MTEPVSEDCAALAIRLERLAYRGGIAGAVLMLLTVFIASTGVDDHPLPITLLVVAIFSALASLGLAALIRFDAALFQLMAGRDEMEAGAEVDNLLDRMRLKPKPAATRPLPDRIAGARRLAKRLRLALATAAVAAAGAAAVLWL